jgi:hypothetical protein
MSNIPSKLYALSSNLVVVLVDAQDILSAMLAHWRGVFVFRYSLLMFVILLNVFYKRVRITSECAPH